MTTKHSPLNALRLQAEAIAMNIKAAERGEIIDVRFAEKLKAARNEPSVRIGIVMDDKTLIISIPWENIRSSGEVALSEYILREMREIRSN